MTDGQLLFAVFTAFYLLECVRWLPVAAQVFRTWAWKSGWTLRQPLPYLAGRGLGPALMWPLPPLGGLMTAQSWPVLPDADGLWIGPGQLHAGRALKWSEIQVTAEKQEVVLAAGVSVLCVSARAARVLRTLIERMQSSKPDQRAVLIDEFWKDSLSLPAARAAVRRFRLAASLLRLPCIGLFFLCFGWLPYVFWWFSGDVLRVGSALLSVLFLDVLVALTWRSLDRRIFGDATSRWAQVLHLMVMPAHAIRALDLIGHDVASRLHPVVVAAAILPKEQARVVAGVEWRNWKYRQAALLGGDRVTAVLAHLEACVIRLGYRIDEMDAPPQQEPGTTSFCPCCHEPFVTEMARCQACGDLETRVWPSAV